MEKDVLQLSASGEHVGREAGERVVREVDVPDGGHLEHLAVSQGHKGVRVELLEEVPLQVNQLQCGQAVEGLGVEELDAVVIHVESDQALQASERLLAYLLYLVVAQLQDLRDVKEESQSQQKRFV